MKKKILLPLLASLLFLLPLGAQEPDSREGFLRRYNNLVDRVGPDGLGVESLLDKWAEAWPDDTNQQLARFSFCFSRCRTARIEQMDRDRYLGQSPVLPMTDSLGNKVNYFQVFDYDDEVFGAALQAITKAISAKENQLDWRFSKIDALLAYEKEEPEMALQELKTLVDYHFTRKPDWAHEQLETVTPEQFNAFMQDYCVHLFRIGSDTSTEAFRSLSEHLLRYSKNEPLYMDNIGSYYLLKKDYKKAQKQFDQVLKKHPSDLTALKNCILMARTRKDVKMEKKYLALMAANAENETDRMSAQVRLEALGKK